MKNKALFLDRDGTINTDDGFVHRIEDFRFIDGIFDLCLTAQRRGYLLIVITNQSGIERGFFTESDFQLLTDWMIEQFRQKGIVVQDVFHCPYLTGEDRKPNPGLFLKAQTRFDLDMSQSISLGDKERDVEAGIRAGVGKNYLYSSIITQSCADRIITELSQLKDWL